MSQKTNKNNEGNSLDFDDLEYYDLEYTNKLIVNCYPKKEPEIGKVTALEIENILDEHNSEFGSTYRCFKVFFCYFLLDALATLIGFIFVLVSFKGNS